jgi:hypothetical protein
MDLDYEMTPVIISIVGGEDNDDFGMKMLVTDLTE